MRCLVTGATGLIGSHLMDVLGRGHEVFAVSRRPEGFRARAGVVSINADLCADICPSCLPAGVDAVVHLAQSRRFRDFPDCAEEIFKVNVHSTMRLFDYARRAGAKTFILASSGGIYGAGNDGFNEETVIQAKGGLGFYLGTKLCSEILAENYAPYMNVVILRFFFVYGPGQRKDMLIPRLVDSVRDGRPITLQGADGIRINPVYVTDAAAAIVKALSLEGSHKINVGGPGVLSLRDIAVEIGRALGKDPVFDVKPGAEPRNLIGDISKMSAMLAPPSVRFSEGIRRYINTPNHG